MRDEAFIQRLVRVALAVYRVADRLPAMDPIAPALREATLQVTAFFITLFYNRSNNEYNCAMTNDLETLMSYFYIARGQNWVDRRNFDVLIQEYRAIQKEYVREETSSVSQKNIAELSPAKRTGRKVKKATYFSSHVTKFSDRQQKIFQFIQEKKKSGFGAIADNFPDTSPRTIRRDLDMLVQANFLSREGTTKDSLYRIEHLM